MMSPLFVVTDLFRGSILSALSFTHDTSGDKTSFVGLQESSKFFIPPPINVNIG